MLESFIPSDLVRALHADESEFTHSIALPVNNPKEINSIFDDISYGKGSSVIRMLESWMDDQFEAGHFLNKLHCIYLVIKGTWKRMHIIMLKRICYGRPLNLMEPMLLVSCRLGRISLGFHLYP